MKPILDNANLLSAESARTQYGAICWRTSATGLDVLLITTRDTGRWIVPKGWPIKDCVGPEVAAREAWEEAGVEGKVCDTCLGVFSYQKLLPEDRSVPCVVAVYGLKVEKLSRRYPEQHQRQRRWFAAHDAAILVAEPGLSTLLMALETSTQEICLKDKSMLSPPVHLLRI